MKEILLKLNETAGVSGSLVVGRDGLVIESAISGGINSDLIGAIVAGIYTSVESSMDEFQVSELTMVTVESSYGMLLLCNVGAILVVLLGDDVNFGIVRLDVKNAVAELINAV